MLGFMAGKPSDKILHASASQCRFMVKSSLQLDLENQVPPTSSILQVLLLEEPHSCRSRRRPGCL
jgi:hypothetical protein